MSYSQERHFLSLTSSLGKDYLILTEFEGQEGLSQLFTYHLRVFSTDTDLLPSKLLGKNVTFQITDPQGENRFFNGIVSKLLKGNLNFNGTRNYFLEVVPWLWFLTLTSTCQIFQNKTSLQILENIFQDAGFREYEVSSLQKSYVPREYCVQYEETMFHFISRLMEEEGIFYYFLHKENAHTLILGDSNSAYYPLFDKDVHFSDGTFAQAFIQTWEHEYRFCTGKFSHLDYNFEMPSKNLLTSANTLLKFPDFKKYENFEYPGFYKDLSPGQERAKLRMEAEESKHEKTKGEGSYCHLSPGGIFSLGGSETPEDRGDYVITSIYHKAIDKSHTPRDATTPNYTNNFTGLPRQYAFHPERISKKPSIPGCQTAIVVGPQNEEIYTDKYGRIKINFFWDRKGTKDEKSSCWVRVSQSIAGNNWGSFYIPRIGQEVIVSFLNGDIDSPIVTGCVYNATAMPPYELPNFQTKMGLKTHSSEGGITSEANELIFDDKKGTEEIYLHAQKDFNEIIENDFSSRIGHDSTIEVQNNLTTTVKEGNQAEVIEKGDRTITVKKGDYQAEIKTGDYILKVDTGNSCTEIKMGDDMLVISQGNQSTKVSLGKSSLEALQGIELTVGQNSIKIDQSGVTIQGLMIKINGTMVQANANALLQLKGTLTTIN